MNPPPPPPEKYQVVTRGTKYRGCGEEYNVKKGKVKQYYLPYNIETVGKMSSWEK